MIKKFAFALSTTFLIPMIALAQEDDFGISDAPVEKAAPVYLNSVEVGAGYSSVAPPPFGRFNGLGSDHFVPTGNLSYLYRGAWDQPDTHFLRVEGAAVGTDSRRFRLDGGEQGSYKLFFGYDATTFNDFRGLTPFSNEGGDYLPLVAGWTRANTVANLSSASVNKMREVDIRTERERLGSGVTWKIDPQWSLKMAAKHEQKEGLKPVGVNTGSIGVIAPEPVNYQDDRVESELAFTSKRVQARFGYQFSMFRNENDSLTLTNPFTDHLYDRIGTAPENTAHSFFSDTGIQLSETTRLVTNLSYSQYLQDQAFLPYGVNSPTITVPMPRDSLDGRIATTIANLELTSKPLSRFDTKMRYRFTNRRNDTPVSEFVYVMNDNENQNNATDARHRRNTPFSYKENLVSGDIGYSLDSRTKLSTGYEFRTLQRSHSERAKNIDQTTYVGIRGNLTEGVSGNAKFSRMWRDGSTYDPRGSIANTNNAAWVATNGYDNHPLLRKFFQADVIRDKAQAGVTFAPTESLNFGLSGGVVVDEYVRSELGLTDALSTNATLDASWAPRPDLTMTGFYTYERRTTDQAGMSSLTDNNQRWYVNIADDAHTTGLGAKWQMREGVALMLDYAFVWTVTEVDPTRGAGSTLSATAASFPDITSKSHSLSARAEYDLTERVVLGLGYALEIYRSKDWAIDNVNANSVTGILTMGEMSPNYDAHLVMATTRYKF